MLKQLLQLAAVKEPPMEWPTYDGKTLDRSEFLTSSEVGHCLRKAYFSKFPREFPPKSGNVTNGFAERGKAIETWLVAKLKWLEADGYKFEFMGEDQRSFYDPENGLSGTPDGLMTDPTGGKWVIEIKSIDPRSNKNNLPKKPHVIQTQQNMYLVELCLGIKCEGAILFYIDASNLYDTREWIYERDPNLKQIVMERAEKLWKAEVPDDLEPEGLFNGDCETCDFTHHCSATINMQQTLEKAGAAAAPFSVELGDTVSLNEEETMMVEQWLDAREGEKNYRDQREEVDDEVKKLVIRHNGRVQVDGKQIIGLTVAGRETLDKDKMIEAGINVTAFTKTGKPYVTLNVKEAPIGKEAS